MTLDTHIDDLVVLVINKEHPRHGQIGKITYHDWKEYGDIGVRFSNGDQEEFYDGIMKGDPPSKIKRFYRHDDNKGKEFDSDLCGPISFQHAFVEHGGKLEILAEQYKSLFNENWSQTNN